MKGTRRGATSQFIRSLSRSALIAALYVILTFISALYGASGGIVQFRISEILVILPIFTPDAIAGLTLGCLIANIATGCVVFDIVFGTLATLIGAVGAYMLRRLPIKLSFIATLPNVIANTAIIPFVLKYAYGSEDSYIFILISIFLSQLLSAGAGGYFFGRIIKDNCYDRLLK